MGTRSTIWVEKENGLNRGIYCHWDGYLDNNGMLLNNFYTSLEKINKLIDLGHISSLHENIEPSLEKEHSFENPETNVVVAYHRDRGEELNIFEDIKKEDMDKHFEEYNYLFKNNQWFVQGYLSKDFVLLREYEILEEKYNEEH